MVGAVGLADAGTVAIRKKVGGRGQSDKRARAGGNRRNQNQSNRKPSKGLHRAVKKNIWPAAQQDMVFEVNRRRAEARKTCCVLLCLSKQNSLASYFHFQYKSISLFQKVLIHGRSKGRAGQDGRKGAQRGQKMRLQASAYKNIETCPCRSQPAGDRKARRFTTHRLQASACKKRHGENRLRASACKNSVFGVPQAWALRAVDSPRCAGRSAVAQRCR